MKRISWTILFLVLIAFFLAVSAPERCANPPKDNCVDNDGDNYGEGSGCDGTDCDDTDKNVNPGADEICLDHIDNDCDTLVDLDDSDCPSSEPADFREETIYFLILDRFANGANSNNNENQETWGGDSGYQGGDFKGILDNLDYIKNMGFTTLWITPIVDNPEYRYKTNDPAGIYDGGDVNESSYHGYWGKDFSKVDEHWESVGATFDDLVREVHSRKMKLIVDVVPNHASPAYYFQNGEPQQLGEVWENGRKIHDHGNDPTSSSGEMDNPPWFHHNGPLTNYENQNQNENNDLKYLADFNHENPAVKQWLIDTYKTWLKKGIDGFRIDALKHMPRDSFIVDFAAAMLKQKNDFFMFGENFNGDPTAPYGPAYYTWNKSGGSSGLSVLDFPNYYQIQNIFLSGASYEGMQWLLSKDSTYYDGSKLVTFVDNHDVSRFCGDEAQLKNALNWIFTARGIPSIYYGTEEQFQKCYAAGAGRGYYGNEISKATSHPIYSHIKKLNEIRKMHPALQKGTLQSLPVKDAWNSFAFKRVADGQEVYVALNKSGGWANFSFPNVANGDYEDQMSGYVLAVSNGSMEFGVSANSMAVYVKK
jgi:cyclomaltodextrin glucanotransferase